MDGTEVLLYLFVSIWAVAFSWCCVACLCCCQEEEEKTDALAYFPYPGAAAEASGETEKQRLECAICLEAFVHGVAVGEVTACRHLFHRGCIQTNQTWMRSKSTCPVCRGSMKTVMPVLEPLSAAQDMV